MANRLAVMSIIISSREQAQRVNELLHEYGDYIIGRMGIPYRTREVNIIAIFLDGPQDVLSSLSGKLGKLEDTSVKVQYAPEQ